MRERIVTLLSWSTEDWPRCTLQDIYHDHLHTSWVLRPLGKSLPASLLGKYRERDVQRQLRASGFMISCAFLASGSQNCLCPGRQQTAHNPLSHINQCWIEIPRIHQVCRFPNEDFFSASSAEPILNASPPRELNNQHFQKRWNRSSGASCRKAIPE